MHFDSLCLCYCAILVFNKRNTANSLPLYVVKTDACVKCNYTLRECLLLPRDAAMLARFASRNSVRLSVRHTRALLLCD